MKKNFMIAVNKDNAEAYKKTLIALGYAWTNLENYCFGFTEQTKNIYGYPDGQSYCWFSGFSQREDAECFNNIEDFLIWHFTPEKTQAEVELEKLQEQIVSLQNQAEKLKASL